MYQLFADVVSRDFCGVTEQLKARNQMAWGDTMNNIRARAEEVVRAELIYV